MKNKFNCFCWLAIGFLMYAAPAFFSCSGHSTAYAQQVQSGVVLLDFRADWCAPCRQMDPIIARLRVAGWQVQTVNCGTQLTEAKQYGFDGIPAFVVLADGQERGRAMGYTSEENLLNMLRGAAPAAVQQPQELKGTPELATWRIRIGQFEGSGTAIAPQLVATARHLAERPGQKATLWRNDGSHVTGTVLGISDKADAAIIAVDSPVQCVSIGSDVVAGQTVTVYDYGTEGEQRTGTGVVDSRRFVSPHIFASTVIVEEGDSGGGVFNTSGQLVGIIDFKQPERGGQLIAAKASVIPEVVETCSGGNNGNIYGLGINFGNRRQQPSQGVQQVPVSPQSPSPQIQPAMPIQQDNSGILANHESRIANLERRELQIDQALAAHPAIQRESKLPPFVPGGQPANIGQSSQLPPPVPVPGQLDATPPATAANSDDVSQLKSDVSTIKSGQASLPATIATAVENKVGTLLSNNQAAIQGGLTILGVPAPVAYLISAGVAGAGVLLVQRSLSKKIAATSGAGVASSVNSAIAGIPQQISNAVLPGLQQGIGNELSKLSGAIAAIVPQIKINSPANPSPAVFPMTTVTETQPAGNQFVQVPGLDLLGEAYRLTIARAGQMGLNNPDLSWIESVKNQFLAGLKGQGKPVANQAA